MDNNENKGGKMFGLSVTLLFAVGTLIFCIPSIVLLVLYFVLDNFSIWWFIGATIAWMLYWVGLYFMTLLGRWGAQLEKEERENAAKKLNKNPYSHKGPVEPKYKTDDRV